METYIGIIPARYKSSRFPGKPLCDILGKPMIWWVYNSVIKWNNWKNVYIATDSNEICEKCKELNLSYILTREGHVDCLDRASEVVEKLEGENKGSDKYIIIQGDEPLFNIETFNTDLSFSIINFYTEVHDNYDMYDCNTVKVIVSKNQKAIYFSRYTIPYHDDKTKRIKKDPIIYKQLGIYVFTGEMLKIYNSLKPSSLEVMEGIGLNRLIENDISISMRYTKFDSISVDTPSDRDRIIQLIKKQFSDNNQSIDDNGNIINCNGYRIP
jgi:3-deoxy-manno-octulosonate cytidylyltransferase (CMP-KDO synthetase)